MPLLGPRRDVLLITAAPLWILPLTLAVASLTSDRAVNDWVLALGATGHHLPGMLRAYGDRALFRRFRLRLLLAPVLITAACLLSVTNGLHGLALVAFVWGVWHALFQTYGFARIYGAREAASARLDLALLATWFVAAVILSPLRLHHILDLAATCGVPLPAPQVVAAVKAAAITAAGVATLLWLAHAVRHPPGILRATLLVSSIAFWWFANVRVRHLLLGMPLFELFHDAQYLSIVWLMNRRRAGEAGANLAAPLRALFRSWPLYVAAVALYGAAGLLQLPGRSGEVLTALLAASQLFHFYLDGFIWKVRDPDVAAPLGLEARPVAAVAPGRHALRWAWVAVPALALTAGEVRASIPLRARVPELATLVPDSTIAAFQEAELRWERGEIEPALAGFRRTLALDPDHQAARDNLALSLIRLADEAAARGDAPATFARLRELVQLRPALRGDVAAAADRCVSAYGSLAAGPR